MPFDPRADMDKFDNRFYNNERDIYNSKYQSFPIGGFCNPSDAPYLNKIPAF